MPRPFSIRAPWRSLATFIRSFVQGPVLLSCLRLVGICALGKRGGGAARSVERNQPLHANLRAMDYPSRALATQLWHGRVFAQPGVSPARPAPLSAPVFQTDNFSALRTSDMTTPSGDQSVLRLPPSWPATLRFSSLLPYPSPAGGCTAGPPRSVHAI